MLNGPVVDTYYEVEYERNAWVVVSYITYANGRRIRNWVAEGPSQEQAYVILNKMRKM